MTDLDARLRELADAATREGRTPGPRAAVRRGRQRRRRIVGTTASLLAVAVLAAAVAVDRVAERRTARPGPVPVPTVALPPLTRLDVRKDPPRKGSVEAQTFADLGYVLGGCKGGVSQHAEIIGYGTFSGYHQKWMIVAKPPAQGEGVCWVDGVFGFGGGGSFSGWSGQAPSPLAPLTYNANPISRQAPVKLAIGYVTKRAARVRVTFVNGRPPVDIAPIDTGGRYPVNFFVGFVPGSTETLPPRGDDAAFERFLERIHPESTVLALDASGRTIARCGVVRPRLHRPPLVDAQPACEPR